MWRVSLGLWVGMAGGMAVFREKGFSPILLGVFLFVVSLIHALWVNWNYERNKRDAKWAYSDLGKAENLLEIECREPLPKCWLTEWLIDWLAKPMPRWPDWLRRMLNRCREWLEKWPTWLCDGPPLVEILATVATKL
jgi:hypothetical protein